MNEERATPTSLDEALAGLEPETASPGFTRRVVAALEHGEQRRAPAFGVRAFAAAATATVALGVFLGSRSEPPLAEIAAERESLRREHGELLRELESLRSMARESGPVLYLGSEQDTDLVLDLAPLLQPPSSGTRPASLEASDRPIDYY